MEEKLGKEYEEWLDSVEPTLPIVEGEDEQSETDKTNTLKVG